MMLRRVLAALPSRGSRRGYSDVALEVPEHLMQYAAVQTLDMSGRCMIVGRPRYKYPIATVPPPQEFAPLLAAIRACESRPFRIISHEDATGQVFNSSFFDDEDHMNAWLSWLSEKVLSSGSEFHGLLSATTDDVPTDSTLLFGRGSKMLADTRFGEYQVGMATNFSRQVPLGEEEHADMSEVAASKEFETRIASCMEENGVAYFGRLAMLEHSDDGKPSALVTALRYGSMEDAKHGTKVVRELMSPELDRWFGNQHESQMGINTQVLEL
jgi:hypothetical protein